jgi:O-Antigen ligase
MSYQVGLASSSGYSRWVLAIALLLFVLAGANGARVWWNSGPIALAIGLSLVGLRTMELRSRSLSLNLNWDELFLFLIGLWALSALASAVFHASEAALIDALFGYLTPFIIGCATWRLNLTCRDHDLLIVALAVGAALPMGYGLIAYLSEWGIPSLQDLFWSKYDVERMESYRKATFGSTGRTAGLLVLVIPILFARVIGPPSTWRLRVILLVGMAVCFCNLLIVQSRTAFAATFVTLAFAAWSFNRKWILVSVLSAAALGVYAMTQIEELENVTTHFSRALAFDAGADTSLSARAESIAIGLDIFAHNPYVGVGPGQSHFFNEHGIAHQIHVAQASELGMLGLVATVGLTIVVLGWYLSSVFANLAHRNPYRLIWLSGCAAWIIGATVANMPVSGSFLSTWVGLFACFGALALGGSEEDHRP